MSKSNVDTWVQIVGAGQMGSGIGEVCALSGYSVHFVDPRDQACEKAKSRIQRAFLRLEDVPPHIAHVVQHDEDADSSPPQISFSTTLAQKPTAWIIEAAPENFEIKKAVWKNLQKTIDDYCKTSPQLFEHTYYASNTSSYSIAEISHFMNFSNRFIGLHFMNPAHKIPLIEVIRGEKTDDTTYHAALDFAQHLQKTAITVQDSPGFVVNRLLIPMLNEAMYILDDGVASVQDIDHAMTLGAAHPMGPLKLADLIGLDTCLAIMNDLNNRLSADKYRPCPLLVRYVEEGRLGKKSGQGFYVYS